MDKATSAALTRWTTWPGHVATFAGLTLVCLGDLAGWNLFCIGVCLIALACWLSSRRQGPTREQS